MAINELLFQLAPKLIVGIDRWCAKTFTKFLVETLAIFLTRL